MSKNKGAEYWKKRFEALEAASNAYGQQTFGQIEPAFDKAQREIQGQIESWYGRYAKNNNITMTEARRQLSTKELKEFRWDVNEYIKYGRENDLNQMWMKELENASARVHISRLEALKVRTQHAAEVAFGNELDHIDAMARKVFTEDYYHTIYEVQKGFGIGWEIGQIDERKLEKIISKPWAADGKNFSNRVWNSKAQMVSELHNQLTRTCILGKAPDDAINEMSKFVDKKFKNAKVQAGRLVMTEQAYFHSVAQQEAFNELDVEEFEVVATLDSHTSEICQEMDGNHFPMTEYQPGVTAPPFHVWCRSVTVPWFEDNYTGERAARDEDGNTYYVPDSMTYKDWKKSMVDGDTNGLKPIDLREFEEVTDALDFGYGDLTQDDYIKWWDAYDEHNKHVHLSKEELQYIEDYTEGGFIGFNDVSRYSDAKLLKKGYSTEDITRIRKKADVLEGALSKYDLDTNIVTHRFERDVSWLTGNGNGVEELEKLIGSEYTTDGFTSSGMLPNRFRFTGGKSDAVHFEIVTPKGTNGAFLSMSKKGENEFLYNRKTKFRVLDGGERTIKENKFNFKTMQMEEVEITERFLKVQVIPEGVEYVDNIVEEVKEIKKAIKLEPDMFPSSFTKTKPEAKNTQAIIDYINNCEDANPDVVELYSKMSQMENIESEGIEWAVKHGKKSEVKYWYNYKGELTKAHISYPKLTLDDPTGQMNTTLHEQMHLMDMYQRSNKNGSGWFSESNDAMKKFFTDIDVDDVKMSPKVKKLFSDFDVERNKITSAAWDVKRVEYNNLRDLYYDKSITYKEYKKRMGEIDKAYDEIYSWGSRNAAGGGVDCLQDIYDALSGGKFRDRGTVIYGHGSKYYRSIEQRCAETLANYGALSITRPELIGLLREDYPELVDMLDDMVKNMLKKVGT